ncbi:MULTISPECIES: AMP-binding protein [unclassified Streptomyces]|uniref:AMP-binding protein n=1 Tax=unclassified Streptomyces TaxID=2593676 RepID=UPI00344DB292
MEPNSSPNTPAAAADASVRVPGAHTDTFTRDHLPPPEQWPKLLLDDPGLRYPDRLNCGYELLDRTVEERGPDRPALRSGDGGVWSYGELRETVDRIAHVLTEDLAVVPGNRVLLRGPTTPWLAACWLAVMKAGAVAVTVLAQARADELATICSLARVSHALCDARTAEDLAEATQPAKAADPAEARGPAKAADPAEARDPAKADAGEVRITLFGGDGPADLTRLAAAHFGSGPYRAVDTAADEVALIAFTSGTTGRPKGCMHFHRDLLAVADTFSRQVLRPLADDVFAGSPPLGFTFGLGGLLVFPLRAGASALLLEQSGPRHLLPALARHRVSVLFTAPTAYRTMLGQLDGHDLSALRRCVSAGENLPAATWQAWFEATGLRIVNGIGATELLHIFISAADDAIRPGTIGVPVPGWQARVVDEHGEELPDGEPGLLAVRGPVGCRYLADPRQTEYVRHGWNMTGDTFVREPDGYFRYVARADDMIISSGYNIAGPEVEDALLRHPEVAEAAVVGRADELRGEAVVAHVVLTEGSQQTADSLRAHMKATLAPHKCPRVFVFEQSLPRTATGKLQRFLLRDRPL